MVHQVLALIVSNSPHSAVSRFHSWEMDSMVKPQANFGSVRQEGAK